MAFKKILLVGSTAKGALELSYLKAGEALGIETVINDYATVQNKYIKGGKIGRLIHLFNPIEIWTRKMNRELILFVREFQPDLIVVFGNFQILTGTVACIKTIFPGIKFVWVWPDTPMNLEKHNISNAPLFDFSAIYSRDAVPVMKQLGFKNVHWIPLAGDPFMHGIEKQQSSEFVNDISFVGTWRPERERVMAAICNKFPDSKIEIYGRYWKRDCKNPTIIKCVKGEGLYEKEMAKFFNQSRININVIDDTNFPAANMRFFEIPTANGLQITSSCPEMESIFRHRKEAIYYQNEIDVVDEIAWALKNPDACGQIRKASNELLISAHTYKHRFESILNNI